MRAVYKYSIPVDDREHAVLMPPGAEIVHVACQDGPYSVELWATVDPDVTRAERTFIVAGTGHQYDDVQWKHVGSALTAEGALVWHLLERA